MRIVTYDEMNDPAGFALLSDSAFSHPHTPEKIAARRRLDPRYADPFGFAMMDGKSVVGFVGVLDVKARTLAGRVIPVGGIHNVMTRPDYTHKGIAARLFEHTQEYFSSKGNAFSFLFTSRTLVAWHLYRKLGYEEMPLSGKQPPAVYRIRAVKGKQGKHSRRGKPDWLKAERLFAERWGRKRSTFVNGTGWLQGRVKWWGASAGGMLLDRDGVAYTEPGKNEVCIHEFVARNRQAYERLLEKVDALKRQVTIHYLVHDPKLLRLYRSRGFILRSQPFYVCMARPLGRQSLLSAFGPNFTWSGLDQF